MVKKYQRKGGHGGKRPGAGRPRKKPEPGPFDAFLQHVEEENAGIVALLDEFFEERFGKPGPPPPRLTRAEKKARTAELNDTIRQLRKFGWRLPDDEKDF